MPIPKPLLDILPKLNSRLSALCAQKAVVQAELNTCKRLVQAECSHKFFVESQDSRYHTTMRMCLECRKEQHATIWYKGGVTNGGPSDCQGDLVLLGDPVYLVTSDEIYTLRI